MALTITEALAEIKTIGKRLGAKRDYIAGYLYRPEAYKDPLSRDGGSAEIIKRERQAIGDLEERIVALRRGIEEANSHTLISVGEEKRSIADWIVWRREVAPGRGEFLSKLAGMLHQMRETAKRQGSAVRTTASEAAEGAPKDVIVNINEAELAREREYLEKILGDLDGQLSLKNATVMIDI